MAESKKFKQKDHPEFLVDIVAKDEYDKLKQAVEKLVRKYADGYIFDEPDEDTEQPADKPWRHVSGKLAREIAKELGIEIK